MGLGARAAPPPVVACVDGSAHSASVCAYAAWLAARSACAVEVLHLDDRPSEPAPPSDIAARLEGYIRADGERLIHDAAERVLESGGNLGDLMVGQGPLIDIVARLSETAGAVVVGQRGRSSPDHSLRLGANVLRIAARSAAPICLAPSRPRPVSRPLILFNAAFPDEALARFAGVDPSLDALDCQLVGYGEVRAGPGDSRRSTPSGAIEAFLQDGDFDLLVLPRSALLAHSRRRELEGLITRLDRPVLLPAQGGLKRMLFEARRGADA